MNPRMNPPRGPSIGGPMVPGAYGPGGMRGPPPGKIIHIFNKTFNKNNASVLSYCIISMTSALFKSKKGFFFFVIYVILPKKIFV